MNISLSASLIICLSLIEGTTLLSSSVHWKILLPKESSSVHGAGIQTNCELCRLWILWDLWLSTMSFSLKMRWYKQGVKWEYRLFSKMWVRNALASWDLWAAPKQASLMRTQPRCPLGLLRWSPTLWTCKTSRLRRSRIRASGSSGGMCLAIELRWVWCFATSGIRSLTCLKYVVALYESQKLSSQKEMARRSLIQGWLFHGAGRDEVLIYVCHCCILYTELWFYNPWRDVSLKNNT